MSNSILKNGYLAKIWKNINVQSFSNALLKAITLPKKNKEYDHVTLKIPQELINEMDQVVGTRGYRSRAEIAKEAIREFLKEQNIQSNIPKFERLNANPSGIKIFEHNASGNRLIHVTFSPKGVYCDFHETGNCEHVHFALKEPDVIQILKEKHKEGWKVPDV